MRVEKYWAEKCFRDFKAEWKFFRDNFSITLHRTFHE